MSLSNNPNRTKTIEKRWNKEITRKFRALKSAMLEIPLNSEVTVNNMTTSATVKTFIANIKSIIPGQQDRKITTNVTAAQQAEINAFMAKFKETTIGLFLSTPWQNEYQTQSYVRGIDRADAAIKAQLTAQESASMPLLDIGATALITTDVHAAELAFLHERADTKLTKWLDDLLFDTRSILHEQLGVVSIDDIHEAITDRINVTTSRSRAIAVTEIAQASQRAVIKETQEQAAASGEDIEVRWITVLDNRVRHLHQAWHGQIMSNEQASRNITISPFNCRCAVKPVIKERVPARQEAKYKAERAQLVKAAN